MNITGIYQILNTITKDKYVGRSINIHRRFRMHRCELNKAKHENYLLQKSWNEYGEDKFTFTILDLCNIDELVEREQQYLNSGEFTLNISKSATWPNDIVKYTDAAGNVKYRTRRISDETKRKISEAHKKRIKTPEELEQVRSLSRARIGRRVSDAERARLKAIAPRGPEHPNFGKQASAERKYAIAKANGTSIRCVCGISGKVYTFNSVTQAAKTMRMATDKIYKVCRNSEAGQNRSEYRGFYMYFLKKRVVRR